MNGYLRQSTAAQVRSIGPFIDDGDFKTLENGLTIANTDIVISANGGADTTKASGGATAHGAGGIYTLTWDATDSAAVGELFYSVKVAGALVHFGTYVVLEEAIYDALMAASATGALPVSSGGITTASFAAGAINAAAIADGAIDAATFAAGAITATVVATGAIDADALATDAVAEIADGVWDEDATGHQTQGTFGQAIGDPVADTNTIYKAVVTDATGATVGVDVVAIKAETAAILDDTDDIGVAGAGLTAINLPNQTMDIIGNITGNLSGSVGSVTGAVGSVTGSVGSVTGAVGSVGAGGITAASIATNAIDADALATDAVAEIADGVWDEALAGHLSAGSTGEALSNAGSGASAADIADAVWDEASGDHVGAGSTGERLERLDIIASGGAGGLTNARAVLLDNLDAAVSSRSSQTSVDDLPTNAELATSQAAADDATLAAIAALVIPTAIENADALLARDMGAVAGAADRSPLNAMRFNRNKFTIVAGTLTVFEEDDTTIAWTATITQTAGDPVSASDPA